MSGDQKTVYRTAPVTDLESEEETKNVLYSYMCTKATEDKALEREQVQTLVRSVEQQAVHSALTSSSSMASEVGRRLAEFGKYTAPVRRTGTFYVIYTARGGCLWST